MESDIILDDRTLLIDAREKMVELGSVPRQSASPLTATQCLKKGCDWSNTCSRVVVFGDGLDPDSGRELARELAGRGMKCQFRERWSKALFEAGLGTTGVRHEKGRLTKGRKRESKKATVKETSSTLNHRILAVSCIGRPFINRAVCQDLSCLGVFVGVLVQDCCTSVFCIGHSHLRNPAPFFDQHHGHLAALD